MKRSSYSFKSTITKTQGTFSATRGENAGQYFWLSSKTVNAVPDWLTEELSANPYLCFFEEALAA